MTSLKVFALSACTAITLSLTAAAASAGGLAHPLAKDGLDLNSVQPVGYYYSRCYYKRVRYYDSYTYRYYYRTRRVCY